MPYSHLFIVLMGILGGSDSPDIEAIANRLGAQPNEEDVLRTLDDLAESLDRLVSAAGVAGTDGQIANDAPPLEKANELARLVEQDRIRIEREAVSRDDSQIDGSTVVSEAAEDVMHSRHPSERRATSLLDALQTIPNTDKSELTDVLETVVRRLEAANEVERAITPSDPERTATRLENIDAPLARTVKEVPRSASDDIDEKSLDEIRVTVDRALRRLEGIDLDPEMSLPERIEALAVASIEEKQSDESQMSTAIRRVRERTSAECDPARDLLNGIVSDDPEDVANVLRQTVDALNESATIRHLTGNVDRKDLTARIQSVHDDLKDFDGVVADAVRDRVERLSGMLERADSSNTVTPYTVREEIEFYERDLLPALESSGTRTESPTVSDSTEAAETVDRLEDLRSTLQSQYIDQRTDHNHSIPLFFLSLTEILEEEANNALTAGEPKRAQGIAEATEKLLERIEGLYERNEYSVMLRRLRG